MRTLRATIALGALLALLLPVPSQHGHEAWESDLAPHDHQGQAVMLLGEERCEGDAAHLHAAAEHQHEACPACLGAATRISVATPILAGGAELGATDPAPCRPASAPARPEGRSPSGRAPPASA